MEIRNEFHSIGNHIIAISLTGHITFHSQIPEMYMNLAVKVLSSKSGVLFRDAETIININS